MPQNSEAQPIHTAPENEMVLVYGTLDGWTAQSWVPAFYDWGDEAWLVTTVMANPADPELLYCVYVKSPTHWMPLPEPPAQEPTPMTRNWEDHELSPCSIEARREGCTCGMESVNSASIDPPEPIIDRECPLHGSREDPDYAMECAREDAEFFARSSWDDYG